MKWTAEKWTVVISASGTHELWAVLDAAGNPVAFGGRLAMEAYADKLTACGGVLATAR